MTTALSHQHVFEPGSTPGAAPLLLLHGTGGDEHDLLPLGREVAPGAPLLSVRGAVLENGLPRFFRRFAEGVFDLPDVERRTQSLADFLRAAAARYGFDAARLVALGFSNGANIASSLLFLRPESLAGAILLRPMVIFAPARAAKLAGRKVLISSGARDPIVPPADPARLAADFRRAGAEVTERIQPAGHGLVPGDLDAARKFLGG